MASRKRESTIVQLCSVILWIRRKLASVHVLHIVVVVVVVVGVVDGCDCAFVVFAVADLFMYKYYMPVLI